MKWTKEEEKILKRDYLSKIYIKDIAKNLNRSLRSIQHKTQRMNLFRMPIKIKHESDRKSIYKRYYKNHKEEIQSRKQNRRKRMKFELIKFLGGKCKICGYNKCKDAFDFHHKEGNKEACVSRLIQHVSKEKVLKEVNKCILLCANCHREIHSSGL